MSSNDPIAVVPSFSIKVLKLWFPRETTLGRTLMFLFATLLIGLCSLGWVAYGNPLREVVFSGAYDYYDSSRAFFVEGNGRNPVALTHSAGISLLPHPDYAVAALKWCTTGQIWQEFRTHGRHFIVQLAGDPVETARCVQMQLPRSFSVSIADPMGRSADTEVFAGLIND